MMSLNGFRLGSHLERSGFGGNHVFERPALLAREYG